MLTMTTIRENGLVTVHQAQPNVIPLRFWLGRDSKKPWGPYGNTPYIDWQLVQHWTIGANESMPYVKAIEQQLFNQSKGY